MIRLARPYIEPEILGLLRRCIETGFLTQGEKVLEFEGLLSDYLGARVVAVSSGTSALHVSLLALGIGKGDRVLVPDFTFPATANVVELVGAETVLADIQLPSLNLSQEALEGVTDIRAVVFVHSFGLPGIVQPPPGVLLIEDSACALGAELNGRKCSTLGTVGALSFHPRKLLTTCEGGAVVTKDPALAETVRQLRFHGAKKTDRSLSFIHTGFNYKLSDVHAVFGVVQMRYLDRMIEERKRLARFYLERLSSIDELQPQLPSPCHIYQSFVCILDTSIDRDGVIETLHELGVESTIASYALHAQPYYRQKYRFREGDFPNSFLAYRQGLALPLYPGLTEKEQLTVINNLKEAIHKNRR